MAEGIRAIVLAGGRISPELAEATGASAKGLIEVNGRPVIDAVVSAIENAESISGHAVVCPPNSELLDYVGDSGVPASGERYLDTIRTGFEALQPPDHALLVTSDLPLLTPESLDDFAGQGLQSSASVVYAIIAQEILEAALPGAHRTYVRIGDKKYTGGNVGLVRRDFIETHGQRIEAAFAARKNPIRLAAVLGWGFVLRLLFGRLTLQVITERAEAILGAPVHVVQSSHPGIGIDLDKPIDLADIERYLSSRD